MKMNKIYFITRKLIIVYPEFYLEFLSVIILMFLKVKILDAWEYYSLYT